MTATATKSPINRWKEMAKVIDRPTQEAARDKARAIEEQINRIDLTVKKLLPAEEKAKGQILARKQELEKEGSGLKLLANFKSMAKLSLEPLKWRDQNGLPQLIILGASTSSFKFRIDTQNDSYNTIKCSLSVAPELPESILKCYEDVVGRLLIHATSRKKGVTLTSEFTGIFPTEVRRIIETAKDQFDHVFVIAEAQKWELTESEPTVLRPDPCPLVVGWKNDQLYLIDFFDLTPLENYVASEFRID